MSIGALLRPRRGRSARVPKDLHGAEHAVFLAALRSEGLPAPTPEYRFHPVRRWKFDYAFPTQMVAVEVEGGAWTRGRHTRGAGFIADMEKYNEAAIRDWCVIRVTPSQLLTPAILALIRRALDR